jgi:hypothetical protein
LASAIERRQTVENEFLVGSMGGDIVIQRLKQRMTKDEALNLAAWIVALADPTGEKWEKTLEAVLET